MIKRAILWLFLVSIIAFLPANASIEFETNYQIIYQIGPRGSAQVTQNISLTNKFSNIYAREYQLIINGIEIKNIKAWDQQGNILKEAKREQDQVKIKLNFNQEVVGKNKTLTFHLSYLIPQFAVKKGRVWELTLPQINNLSEIDSLQLVIKAPIAFGELSYASIKPKNRNRKGEYQILEYQKSDLKRQPLILAFGTFQIFDFSLRFYLQNTQPETITKLIPIPPDTPYQSVILSYINPRPQRIKLDQDFNWLAEYQLQANEEKVVVVQGQAKVFSEPENFALVDLLRQQNRRSYLQSQPFWEVDHPLIKKLSQQLDDIEQIYQLVINQLDYDYQNIASARRKGAVRAYQTKLGVCTEFSDLFIALARAAGIPSRELQGFAFTGDQKIISLAANNDVLHSWPEYWDQNRKIWVPVDPTWAKTTGGMDFLKQFDLGHLVFVIHGQSSVYPPPPGAYRSGINQKNVEVKFAKKLLSLPQVKFEADLVFQKNQPAILIKNKSLAPVYQISVQLKEGKDEKAQTKIIDYLPPLGEKTIDISPPGLLSRVFGRPKYHLQIKEQQWQFNYPKPKLNLIRLFGKLLRK